MTIRTAIAERKPRGYLGWWLLFPRGTDHGAAAARFEEKYGYAPERVWQDASNVFAGPAPERREMTA